MSSQDSFTRSIYIGKDRSAEVMKRKEEAEKELRARREAKYREQEQRLVRAQQQREDELRERIRQRQQRELERQKAVLDRRCAQLETQNAKKNEILQRNHEKASRTAASMQKKPTYAFGSSTPRELSYLEKLNHQQRSARNASVSRGTSPSVALGAQQDLKNEQGTSNARAASRFLLPNNRPTTTNTMTKSVFGTLGGGGGPSSSRSTPAHHKMIPNMMKAKQKSTPAKRQQQPLLAGVGMTQSLYVPKTKGLTTNSPRSVYSKNKPATSATNARLAADQQKPKPIIRPRKAQQSNNGISTSQNGGAEVAGTSSRMVGTETIVGTTSSYGIGTTTAMIADNVKQEDMQMDIQMGEQVQLDLQTELEQYQQITDLQAQQPQHVEEHIFDIGQQPELPLPSNGFTLKLEPEAEQEEQHLAMDHAGHEIGMEVEEEQQNRDMIVEPKEIRHTEKIVYEFDADQSEIFGQRSSPKTDRTWLLDETDDTLVPQDQSIGAKSPSDESSAGDMTLVAETPEDKSSLLRNSPASGEASGNTVRTPTTTRPPILPPILPSEQEELRESRRQRLNEILQKTRQENPSGVPPIAGGESAFSNSSNGNGTAKYTASNIATSSLTAVANPLIAANIDKAALAKELLAQRRQQKLQQQKQQEQQLAGVESEIPNEYQFLKQQQTGLESNIENENEHQKQVLKQQQQRPMALANELAASGFFGNNNKPSGPEYYQLPGQIITPQNEYMPFLSSNTVFSSSAAGDHQHHGGTNGMAAQRIPPEDPHMNGGTGHNNEADTHPPEPTTTQ